MSTSSYDYSRIIAAFGIVVFHAGSPGASLGYAALPFFFMLTISLGWNSAAKIDFTRYLHGRTVRLLIPWLLWSAVYGGMKLVEVAMTEVTLAQEFSQSMWLTGPSIHLWFLPFAFAVCLCVWSLARTEKMPVCVASFVAALALQGYNQGAALSVPLAQWAHVAPAVLLGICLATTSQMIGVIVLFSVLSFAFGWIEGLPQIILAALALVACKLITISQTPLSKTLGIASMGVYLVHPLLFSVFHRGLGLDKHALGTAVFVFAASLSISLSLMHARKIYLAPRSLRKRNLRPG